MWHGVRLAWGSLRANRFDWIFSLISDILAKSTPGSFYHCTKYQSNGFDYACFNEHWASTEFWSSKYFSAAQMLKLANTLFDFLLKYRPSPEVFLFPYFNNLYVLMHFKHFQTYASWNLNVKESPYDPSVAMWKALVERLWLVVFNALASEQKVLDIR